MTPEQERLAELERRLDEVLRCPIVAQWVEQLQLTQAVEAQADSNG
jgi:hypothetical protein